jgi:hypothetical protein
MAASWGDSRFEPGAEAHPSGPDEYWTTIGPADGRSPWAAPEYLQPPRWNPPLPPPLPPPARSAATRRLSDNFWVRCGKSISAIALVIFVGADIGDNLAHNVGAVVSRAIPFVGNRPFYFDPLAVVHDVEKVTH